MREIKGYDGRLFDNPGLQEIVAQMRHPQLQQSSANFRNNAPEQSLTLG